MPRQEPEMLPMWKYTAGKLTIVIVEELPKLKNLCWTPGKVPSLRPFHQINIDRQPRLLPMLKEKGERWKLKTKTNAENKLNMPDMREGIYNLMLAMLLVK